MNRRQKMMSKNKEVKEQMLEEMNRKIEESKEDVIVEEIKPDVQLSAPWITFANEMISMFNADEEIKIDYSDEEKVLKLFVDNPMKADALSKVLPTEKEFGNVVVKIEVVPSDKEMSKEMLYKYAFMNNLNVAFVQAKEYEGFGRTYVVFHKYIAQFFNDDLCDFYGNKTSLLQDLAKDIFIPDAEVCFSTEAELEREGNG